MTERLCSRVDVVFRTGLSVLLGFLVLVTLPRPAAAQDTDVVLTRSGDRLVGEIQKLEKDVLTLSTAYSDSDFALDWAEVAAVESSRQFLVETFGGRRLAGSLVRDPARAATVVVSGEAIPMTDISMIQPYERSFWSRFDSGFDFGYSMVRANDAKQLSLGGNLAYRGQRNVDALFVNVFRSSQSNAPRTERWELGNDYRYLLGDRWYVTTTQDFLKSDEQELDLRTTLGAGVGRFLLRSPDQYLGVGAGLAWNRENYQDPALDIQDSGEAYLGTELMTEKLRFADLLTRLVYYPSLTIDNRYRLNYKFDLDFNLPGDWYFRVGLFDNYDSHPPEDLSKNDWGWSNAFGLKF
jgi:putative salt-induced outer membrane protein YdiY